jgi:protein AroM
MNMAKKIGFVTIGQSPREDIVPEIAGILTPEVEIIERGVLDGLSRNEIESLKPEKNDFPLITRLRDGSSAIVGKKKIIPLLKRKIEELEQQGIQLIGLLCTDDFAALKSERLLLQPHRILLNLVMAILKKGTLAVFAPLEDQCEDVKKKWEKTGLKVAVEALNPYQEFSEARLAIERIKKEDAGLIVLDCIGYSQKIKEKIRLATGKPVLLPRTVLARMIKELI